MRFMVIERFANGDARPIYRRFARSGRMMPDGIGYVASWISADFSTCFQIMEAHDASALQRWVAAWSDIVDFEIVPVVTGEEDAPPLSAGLKFFNQTAPQPPAPVRYGRTGRRSPHS